MGRGRIALLRKGESPILPGEEREGGEEGRWALSEREGFSFSDAFKTYITPWEGRPRRFPPNNE
jgi:hypothetical protein